MYGIEFVSNTNDEGYGVVIFETGRILGGDSSFVYVGSYEVKNGIVYADVKCTNDRGMLKSIFGDIREFNLSLQGAPDYKEFILRGYMVENPDMKIAIRLSRRAELP